MRFLWWLIAGVSCARAAQSPIVYSLDASIAAFDVMTRDAAGNLYLAGAATSANFPATPGAYQTKYHANTCSLGSERFSCGDAYVIKLDPAGKLLFATLLGGSGDDRALAIALDAAGYIYITGATGHLDNQANDFPITEGALFPQPAPPVENGTGFYYDGFLSILSPDGSQLIYSTYLPAMVGPALALDLQKNIYLAGDVDPYNSSMRPTPGAFQTKPSSSPGELTALLMKLRPGGTMLAYATYLGDPV